MLCNPFLILLTFMCALICCSQAGEKREWTRGGWQTAAGERWRAANKAREVAGEWSPSKFTNERLFGKKLLVRDRP